jgi:aryl-alcohol dehydrogenase-like predicted oxidoreductase
MKQRKLGQDGPIVSAIGIGAMSFADFYGATDEAASHAILDAAMDLGITHIDTANVYGMGKSEKAIGSYFSNRPEARHHFRVATKAAIGRGDHGNRRFDNSARYLERELDASLARLTLDAVDLFYVHRRDPELEIEEVTETLAGFVRAGKIKAFGYSEIAPSSLRRAAAVHPVAAVQSEYSLSTRSPEMGLVQTCSELGTALVAFSPVARGLLTDRPHNAEAVQNMPFLKANPRFTGENLGRNVTLTEPFRALATEMGTTAATLANAWVLSRGDHIISIPGTRSVDHLREHVAGGSFVLSPTDLARIDAVLPIGWAHGDRYSLDQWDGPERYC